MREIKFQIRQPQIEYQIEIKKNALNDSDYIVNYFSSISSNVVLLTDENIAPLYANPLSTTLKNKGIEVQTYVIPSGEIHKNRQVKEQIETKMLEKGLGRDTCLAAIGGGVVIDLGGYIAATYCRGIPLVLIPTSLLAMVDASIGGKNGVNVPNAKNMIGTIYQPKKVIIDSDCLKTLPLHEKKNGIVEMIKHGLIADSNHFNFLEKNYQEILNNKDQKLETAIFDSCNIKKAITQEDEKETGKRRLLNFGHTIGHALESITNYAITHGEAVAIGLISESYLAMQLGYLSSDSFDRINSIVRNYQLPLKLPKKITVENILHAMKLDKKAHHNVVRLVMIKNIGEPLEFNGHYCTAIDEKLLKNSISWMLNDLCSY